MQSLYRMARFLKRYRFSVILALTLLAIATAADLSIPRLTQTIIDQGINANNLAVVWRTALAMLGMTVLSAAAVVGNSLVGIRVSQSAAADIRREFFEKVQHLSFGNLDRLHTGQLLVRLTSDVNRVLQLIVLTMRMFVRAPLMIIGSLILLFATNWQLALFMLLLLPLSIAVFWLFATRARPQYLAVQRKLGALNVRIQEGLNGIRVIKSFGQADNQVAHFGDANDGLLAQSVQVGQLMAHLLPLVRLIVNLGMLCVVWFGGRQVIEGRMTLGELVAVSNYLISVVYPLTHLGMMAGLISSADASAERILEVLDAQPDIPPHAARVVHDARIQHGRVAFEGVSFSYAPGADGQQGQPVLSDIDLIAQPGEIVAILGATGSGKTSLISLIPRFYEATQGRVTIDGRDVRDYELGALRSSIGVVAQHTRLFSGTLYDNIAYGRPDAPQRLVEAVAQVAQADAFIRALPDGYASRIGQRGVTLSGGQRQRIAIARALLLDPRILILDDSTSAVDFETEAQIRTQIRQLISGEADAPAHLRCTVFVVAQRISTVMHADKIVVLDRGRIAAVGTHNTLLHTDPCPFYQELYRTQIDTAPPPPPITSNLMPTKGGA